MKKYKVLMVHNYYQIPGGEDTAVENEREMLLRNGHEVIMYTRNNSEILNVGIIGKTKLFFQTTFSLRTYREVKQLIRKENIDILHVHNTLPLVSPSIYYAAFSRRVPVVQVIHNFRLLCPGAVFVCKGQICEKCNIKGLRNSILNKCYRNSLLQTLSVYTMLRVHRLLGTYRKLNGYIVLTEFSRKKFLKLVGDSKKLFVKPNFMKASDKSFVRVEAEDYFVFIGRIDKLKGINLLIEVWKNIKDFKLMIIGEGPEKQSLEYILANSDIDNIQLLGFMERKNAFEIIKRAKATILPSQWYEGFPMTVVESFSLGVPVIAGNIGSLGELIEHRKNGLLFKYDSTSDLINAIDLMGKDDRLRNRMSERAYETFKNLYTDEKNYITLMKIYEDLIRR